jgi:nicotinamidase-related amidase
MNKTEDNKTALIIDIQNDYFPGGTMELASADDTATKAANVLSYFRKEEMPVIHVQHLALQEGANFFCLYRGAEIHKSMTPLKTEVITKNFQIVLEIQYY